MRLLVVFHACVYVMSPNCQLLVEIIFKSYVWLIFHVSWNEKKTYKSKCEWKNPSCDFKSSSLFVPITLNSRHFRLFFNIIVISFLKLFSFQLPCAFLFLQIKGRETFKNMYRNIVCGTEIIIFCWIFSIFHGIKKVKLKKFFKKKIKLLCEKELKKFMQVQLRYI